MIYGRFVVTHLADAGRAVAGWAQAASAHGRLALEETAAVTSDEPVLARYYALVERMQAAHGQRMNIGRDLAELGRRAGWIVESAELRAVDLPGATAARLHAMNFRTWRHESVHRGHGRRRRAGRAGRGAGRDRHRRAPGRPGALEAGAGDLAQAQRLLIVY